MHRLSGFLFSVAAMLPVLLFAQGPFAPRKYWIEFTDKNQTPYSVWRPAEFLSARALERRARAGIAVTEEDLPVDPAYLAALRRQPGVVVHHSSRWLNAATVVADSASAAALRQLPFVRQISYLGPHIRFKNPPDRPPKTRNPVKNYPPMRGGQWGYAARQNTLLGLGPLHTNGLRGHDRWVVVMDGGFTNADVVALFDSAALDGRLLQGRDFVERDGAVYESAAHGTTVLGVMAANMPGWMVGAAPDATYFLVKTEDTGGEYPVEEANWLAGAEWADSLGADLINASLGYTAFNDSRLNHSYRQLDGRSAIASRGAAIAARKGMIVCNSAGNEGDGDWRHIGVPADAPGLIAVGAVDLDGLLASFSSVGPTADGRIKPELVAPGAPVISTDGSQTGLDLAYGTSLASPMLTGAMAALWSAYPDRPAAEILDAVFASADQVAQPDNRRGYGLPDLSKAWLILGGFRPASASEGESRIWTAFDRPRGELSVMPEDFPDQPLKRIVLRNSLGKSCSFQLARYENEAHSLLKMSALENLPPGLYWLDLTFETVRLRFPFALYN